MDHIQETTRFLWNTLETSAGIDTPQIFAVSARHGLQARRSNDKSLWSQSGMAALQHALTDFAVDGKQSTLAGAIQRKAVNLMLKTEHLLALEQQAAQMPLAELEQTIAAFKLHAQRASQQRQEILDRLNGDVVRLRAQLEEFASGLRAKAQPQLMALAEKYGLPTDDEAEVESFHREVRQIFDAQQAEASEEFRPALKNILTERAQTAGALREALRQDAATLLAIPHISLLTEEIVVDLAEPGWTIEHLPVRVRPGFGSKWLPKSIQRQQYIRLREKLVNELTTQNVEKIRWWLLQTIDESINRFRRKITTELEETIQHIDHALQTGYQHQQSTQESQQKALNALIVYRTHLDQIRRDIEGYRQVDGRI